MSYIETLKNVKKGSAGPQKQSQMVLNLTLVVEDFNVIVTMSFVVLKQAEYKVLNTIKSLDHYMYLYMDNT